MALRQLEAISISRGFPLEIIFPIICLILSIFSILLHNLVEEVPIKQSKITNISTDDFPISYVPAFRSSVSGSHSWETYHVHAWKLFIENYLSQDGIFIPKRPNSNGPDYHAISSCGVGSSTMKTKVAKFLYPISSQLELEKINITAIQLIISNKYTTQVSIEFRDN
eukprot:jgi/Galph1/3039/GphlegSOOS_G1758.1